MSQLQIVSLMILTTGILLPFTVTTSSNAVKGPSEPAAHGYLIVANKGEESLGIVDPESGQLVAVVAEGGTTGHEVAASADGKFAYVPIYGNSGVGKPGTDGNRMVVIDIGARKVIGAVDFGRGVRPHCAVFGPKNGLLYVTTELDNAVRVIDPRTLKIVSSIPTEQPESHMLAITRDGKRGYTANVGPGTVSVLDLEAQKTIAVIPVSANIQRIALSVDDRLVFTGDQTKPELVVIDTKLNKVTARVTLPAAAYGTAPTRDGRSLIVALPAINKVAVVDLLEMKVTRTIDVPRAPQFVLVRPDNQVAYVSCDASHKIAAINLSSWQVDKLIDAGKGADGLAWAAVP
jgi:YVTN family beta-propeller protein